MNRKMIYTCLHVHLNFKKEHFSSIANSFLNNYVRLTYGLCVCVWDTLKKMFKKIFKKIYIIPSARLL